MTQLVNSLLSVLNGEDSQTALQVKTSYELRVWWWFVAGVEHHSPVLAPCGCGHVDVPSVHAASVFRVEEESVGWVCVYVELYGPIGKYCETALCKSVGVSYSGVVLLSGHLSSCWPSRMLLVALAWTGHRHPPPSDSCSGLQPGVRLPRW
jgi:hypothetical protein